ncbi:membrane transporter [Cryptococcus deuterogattii LA55]|nr:membrane transporter [Cryptococcus deuterogattii LA55]KIR92977.1 membrane transporter [Cryptococcus deuterogattii CBS 10090]
MATLQSKDDILDNEVVMMEPVKAQCTSQVNTTEVLKNEHIVQLKELDEAAAFVAGLAGEIDPAAARRVRRKIDLHLLPLMMTLYFVQFTDKATLGSANIMGLKKDTHISQAEYKAANIVIWGAIVCCHAACNNFASLFVCRFLLGVFERSITMGFLIVTTMFYTHAEATTRISYWFLMNGTAQIFNGLVTYGVYNVDPNKIHPWRLYMIITGGLTLLLGLAFWFLIPDSPLRARFLTHEEKIIAIERLRNQSTGTENKTWKKDQFIEALTDWKSWAFAIFAFMAQIPNSLSIMTQQIINSFGFTVQQTNLLGCVNGVIEILIIYSMTLVVKKWNNARGYIGAAYSIPIIVSAILLMTLPFSQRGVLLFAIYLGGTGVPAYVLALAWCASSSTGHTKKTTANAMLQIGYCVGNLISPQIWRAQYAPRYLVPWAIILASRVISPILLLIIRYYLNKENRRRDALQAEIGEAERFFDENGNEIDTTFLDITDRKNLAFRYPL